MPALQKEMQASSTSNFRYLPVYLTRGISLTGGNDCAKK